MKIVDKIFNKIYAIICYGISILLIFDKIQFEDANDPLALIFVLLGSLLIEVNKKNK